MKQSTREGGFKERKKHLFQLIQDLLGVREIPVGEQFIHDSEILTRLRESREEPVDVALGLLFDDTAEALEETNLSTRGLTPPMATTAMQEKTMAASKPRRGWSSSASMRWEGASLQWRVWEAGALNTTVKGSSDGHEGSTPDSAAYETTIKPK